jgi:hypothetical protein
MNGKPRPVPPCSAWRRGKEPDFEFSMAFQPIVDLATTVFLPTRLWYVVAMAVVPLQFLER